jgi:hypothetical protein
MPEPEQEEHFLLTKAKLTEMVKVAFKAKKVEMIDCKVQLATAKGDNYCGEVSRCDMIVQLDDSKEKKELNWICKTIPEKPFFPKSVLKAMHLEDKEVGIYEKASWSCGPVHLILCWNDMIQFIHESMCFTFIIYCCFPDHTCMEEDDCRTQG